MWTQTETRLYDALISMLNIEHAALLGGQAPAMKGLDVAGHFEKARAALKFAENGSPQIDQIPRNPTT